MGQVDQVAPASPAAKFVVQIAVVLEVQLLEEANTAQTQLIAYAAITTNPALAKILEASHVEDFYVAAKAILMEFGPYKHAAEQAMVMGL